MYGKESAADIHFWALFYRERPLSSGRIANMQSCPHCMPTRKQMFQIVRGFQIQLQSAR